MTRGIHIATKIVFLSEFLFSPQKKILLDVGFDPTLAECSHTMKRITERILVAWRRLR
jgi:hypothetical protein